MRYLFGFELPDAENHDRAWKRLTNLWNRKIRERLGIAAALLFAFALPAFADCGTMKVRGKVVPIQCASYEDALAVQQRATAPARVAPRVAPSTSTRTRTDATHHEIDITGKDYGDRYNVHGDGPINWNRFNDDWDNWKEGKPIKYDPDGLGRCVAAGGCSTNDGVVNKVVHAEQPK